MVKKLETAKGYSASAAQTRGLGDLARSHRVGLARPTRSGLKFWYTERPSLRRTRGR